MAAGRLLDVERFGRAVRPKVDLGSKRARLAAAAHPKPYWQSMDGGAGWQLGYRVPTREAADAARYERIAEQAGAWLVRWWDKRRKEHSKALRAVADDFGPPDNVRVMNFKQAVDRARKIYDDERGVQRGKEAGPKKRTVSDVFEVYERAKEADGHDVRDARSKYKKHIEPRWGDVRIEDLAADELKVWLIELAGDGPSQSTRATANRVWVVLRAALNHGLHEQGIAPRYAVWQNVKPLANADSQRDHVLTAAEIKRLVNGCDDELRPLVLATAFTGGRFGDVREIRAGDVDLQRKVVRLRGMKTRNKTTRRGYDVALSDEAAKFFGSLAAGRAPDDLLITRLDGSRWGASAYRRQLLAANERAKLIPPAEEREKLIAAGKPVPEPASLYTLRHSFATALVEAKVPLVVIAKAMGHRDGRMVEKHYGHPSDDWSNEQVRGGLPTFGVKLRKTNVVSLEKRGAAGRASGRNG